MTHKAGVIKSTSFKFHSLVDVCYNGKIITDVKESRYWTGNRKFGVYDMGLLSHERGGSGSYDSRNHKRGKMDFCVNYEVGCYYTAHPTVGIKSKANGTADFYDMKDR